MTEVETSKAPFKRYAARLTKYGIVEIPGEARLAENEDTVVAEWPSKQILHDDRS